MPRAMNLMKKREKEILKTILHLSEKTNGFTNPKIVMIGGYALRAFIKFSRYTRDCDFILQKKNGWSLDDLKKVQPKGYIVEKDEKRENYGFMRWTKFLKYDELKIKVSADFMEGEIRGRKKEEIIIIDETMMKNSKSISIPIADKRIEIIVPSYLDYFIMKIISARASDIRDIASLIHENKIPSGLKRRIKKILPYPKIFKLKIQQRVIPEITRHTFIDSWKGIFATTEYTEEDKKLVLKQLKETFRKW